MNVFEQLFLQVVLIGTVLGSFAGVLLIAIIKELCKLVRFLINKAKENQNGEY